MRIRVLPNLLQDELLLLEQQRSHLKIFDLGQHCALHDGSAFVIFDVPRPQMTRQRDFLSEALLFEVTESIIIGVGKEMLDSRMSTLDPVLDVIHKMRAITLEQMRRQLKSQHACLPIDLL